MDVQKIEEGLRKSAENHGATWDPSEGVTVAWAHSSQEWGEEFSAGIQYFFAEGIPCKCFSTIENALAFLAEKANQLTAEGWKVELGAGELLASK